MTGLEIGLAVVGGALQAASAMQQANAAAAAADHAAAIAERDKQVADQNRQIELKQKQLDASDERRDNRRTLAAIRTQMGGSGFDLGGSVVDVLEDASLDLETNAQRIEEQGRTAHRAGALEMLGYDDAAALERMKAKSAKKAGPVGAAASLIGGASRAATAHNRNPSWYKS